MADSVAVAVDLAAAGLLEDGSDMNIKRILRHALAFPWQARLKFPEQAMQHIAQAIAESEASHHGEIRFAVEPALDIGEVVRGKSAHERAIEVFSNMKIWDTERNNGVLIYLLLADHRVEIVADRGIDRVTGQAEWESICREMEQAFRQGRFEEGVVAAIRRIAVHLVRYYPAQGENENELPDMPIVL